MEEDDRLREAEWAAPELSMIALIANPKSFHGMEVVVTGFFRLAPEHQAIYISREHAEHALSANGLWLEFSKETSKQLPHWMGRYIRVRGTFNARSFGHLSGWAGTIENVTEIQPHVY